MKRIIQLEPHEKAGLAATLDMLNQAIEDVDFAEELNDCGERIGITVDDVYEFLREIFCRYV